MCRKAPGEDPIPFPLLKGQNLVDEWKSKQKCATCTTGFLTGHNRIRQSMDSGVICTKFTKGHVRNAKTCGVAKGGSLNPETETPPLQAPNVVEPFFVQFQILGTPVGANCAGFFFFFWPLEGDFVLPKVSLLKIIRFLSSIQKWVKNTKNILTSDPTSGSDLG